MCVAGFDGYEISSLGRVRCWLPRNRFAAAPSVPRMSALSPLIGGYVGACLAKSGSKKTMRVHRLVLEAFVGPCPPGMEASHKNGQRNDNRLSNLEWTTHVDNNNMKRSHGTWQAGDNHGASKVTSAHVAVMRYLSAVHGASCTELAEWFGISRTSAHRAATGRTWKCLPLIQETRTAA